MLNTKTLNSTHGMPMLVKLVFHVDGLCESTEQNLTFTDMLKLFDAEMTSKGSKYTQSLVRSFVWLIWPSNL